MYSIQQLSLLIPTQIVFTSSIWIVESTKVNYPSALNITPLYIFTNPFRLTNLLWHMFLKNLSPFPYSCICSIPNTFHFNIFYRHSLYSCGFFKIKFSCTNQWSEFSDINFMLFTYIVIVLIFFNIKFNFLV